MVDARDITQIQHSVAASAKRVTQVDGAGNVINAPGRTFKYEDTSFTSGDSPITLDVNTDLGRNAVDGYLAVDGTGDILVEISDDGASYGSQHTLKNGDVLDLSGLNVDSIRLTHSGTNSSYRILVV